MNLVSQYNDCSYGKEIFSPLTELSGLPPLGSPERGVYEVEIPYRLNTTKTSSSTFLREDTTDTLSSIWPDAGFPLNNGEKLTDSPFSHVTYCMSPGMYLDLLFLSDACPSCWCCYTYSFDCETRFIFNAHLQELTLPVSRTPLSIAG